jgi:glutamate racemase
MAKEDRQRRIQDHSRQVGLTLPAPIVDDLRPIGVFDSGVGGLSVLRALQAEMPGERFVYVADNGHAPYGERDDVHVLKRSHAITDYLIGIHQIKALVVACNTATAAAIHTLRTAYVGIPIVGIEPALKPAAAISKTGVVGVMATRGTLNSEKFRALLAKLHGAAHFVLQPCDGLADAIERSDQSRIEALCAQYTLALGAFGNGPRELDCLVLGCTHYAFAAAELTRCIGPAVTMLEAGEPVARQTKRMLQLASPASTNARSPAPQLGSTFYSTGNTELLDLAVQRWLHVTCQSEALQVGE